MTRTHSIDDRAAHERGYAVRRPRPTDAIARALLNAFPNQPDMPAAMRRLMARLDMIR